MSKHLRYSVKHLDNWVIMKEHHPSWTDEELHITVRGYQHGRGVLTVHIYVDERYVRQGSSFFATGAWVQAATDPVLSWLHIYIYWRASPMLAAAAKKAVCLKEMDHPCQLALQWKAKANEQERRCAPGIGHPWLLSFTRSSAFHVTHASLLPLL
ncbi:hypothetical protein BDN71DRAFT_1433117 [Pleurotus eryngii]|uniref:Uncharacterized protein n=1 Tax=Pleurotus eryngii TaxID=5323 RepID=A0A9P6DEI2_PLEER|nr:hypothetical protein BDN71DRAFT_1433117 [Pleurotus eryngii]